MDMFINPIFDMEVLQYTLVNQDSDFSAHLTGFVAKTDFGLMTNPYVFLLTVKSHLSLQMARLLVYKGIKVIQLDLSARQDSKLMDLRTQSVRVTDNGATLPLHAYLLTVESQPPLPMESSLDQFILMVQRFNTLATTISICQDLRNDSVKVMDYGAIMIQSVWNARVDLLEIWTMEL